MAKAKHIPPSRKRYEESHPAVSARVSREFYEKLNEIREKTGKSFADMLKEGARLQEPITKKAYDRGYKAGYNAGKRAGINEGKRVYLGSCSICHEILYWDLARDKDMNLVARAITQAGYVHNRCQS